VGYNIISCDRDQQFLMPPSINEWLPKDHLARFVVEIVDMLDLSPFYARRRADGWGRAAYDPKMMVALLIYAYATGTRSSRRLAVGRVERFDFSVSGNEERAGEPSAAKRWHSFPDVTDRKRGRAQSR
jgi:transposase